MTGCTVLRAEHRREPRGRQDHHSRARDYELQAPAQGLASVLGEPLLVHGALGGNLHVRVTHFCIYALRRLLLMGKVSGDGDLFPGFPAGACSVAQGLRGNTPA